MRKGYGVKFTGCKFSVNGFGRLRSQSTARPSATNRSAWRHLAIYRRMRPHMQHNSLRWTKFWMAPP